MRWRHGLALSLVIGVIGVQLTSGNALAYDQYSVAGDATNCRACHGDFRAGSYMSLSDGMAWGSLHDLHRVTMLNRDCNTCHSGSRRFPVMTNMSNGGTGLMALACVGCHGRAEDHTMMNPSWPMGGYGAGLRQHHFRAGVTICMSCHDDANPAAYTPVGEDVLPPYYAMPGTGHPNMPTDSCSPGGEEDFAGAMQGLDNDGDDSYDTDDPDCAPCTDDDMDGFAVEGDTCGPVDCDDMDPDVNPDATETCNNVDDNCDGSTDEGLTRMCMTACGSGTETCNAGAWEMCDAPMPGMEVCDGMDNNCDGTVDEGCTDAGGDSDGGAGSDAGAGADAGPGSDAGTGGDGGGMGADAGMMPHSGGGCAVSEPAARPPITVAFVLLGAALILRRRRRQR